MMNVPDRSSRHTDERRRASRDGRKARFSSSIAHSLDPSEARGRMYVVLIFFAIIAVIIAGRLIWLQVIDAQNILNSDESGRTVSVEVQPRRGTIYDRNGVVLATTVDALNVYCHPHVVDSGRVDELAKALADTFGGEEQDYKDKITQDTNFVYLYRAAEVDAAEAIRSLDIEGVGFEETSKRVYPCGSVASQVIGITNTDGDAVSGLELYYDDILGGQPGERTTEYSAEGVPLPGTDHVTAEVVNGKDVVVSIDVEMQARLEEALLVRVEAVEGKTGSAILMDSATGEIYACASSPTFDITDLSEIEEGATNLTGISSGFEPGSIFKPVTMLAALEAGTTQAGQTYWCPAVLTVDDYDISDSHERPDQEMDTSTIMAESSNVGMSLVAEDLGAENLYNYIKQYQVTDLTNVDYPGEVGGYISYWHEWSTVQQYNIAFGQGLEVSPIEMVRFYGALANNGTAVTPHFLVDVPTDEGETTYPTSSITSNQEAIDNVEAMMEAVVDHGTGTQAQIEGYRVVGKTGTAEIADDQGGYHSSLYNISFIGYLPDSSTNLVCFVGATDVPAERKTVAAFQDIMSFAIERYDITQS